MSEKPKWTATEYRCKKGYVVWYSEANNWSAYTWPPPKHGGLPKFCGTHDTVEEAQAAVENAR